MIQMQSIIKDLRLRHQSNFHINLIKHSAEHPPTVRLSQL